MLSSDLLDRAAKNGHKMSVHEGHAECLECGAMVFPSGRGTALTERHPRIRASDPEDTE